MAPAKVLRVNVTRNPDGSHEPAYDENWPPHLRLEWAAGVTACETGLAIFVSEVSEDRYVVHVGGSQQAPMDRAATYAFLNGVRAGALEARR